MAENEESTEAATVETTEETPSEETSNTTPENRIPLSRFNEVNEKRKEAEGQLHTMNEQVEELRRQVEEAKVAATEQAATSKEAPTNLSPADKIAWYVDKAFKDKTGYSLADAKEVLAVVPTISRQVTESSWSTLCKAQGLDPASTEVRAMVSGLVREAKVTPEQAVAQVGKLMKPATSPKNSPSSAETDGIASTTVVAGAEAWTADEASKLAREGKAVPHEDIKTILAKASKMRAK